MRNLTADDRLKQVRVKANIMAKRAFRDFTSGRVAWIEGCHFDKCLRAEMERLCSALNDRAGA